MKTNAPAPKALPVRFQLTSLYISSLLILVLIVFVSLMGISRQQLLYPGTELQQTFVPNDIVNLCLALPLLLLCLWLTWRGKLAGLLCWPGALFYIAYLYLPYLLTVPFGLLFLPYLLLVTVSLYTLAGLLAAIDGQKIRELTAGAVPTRVPGIILCLLAVFIIFYQVGKISGAMDGGGAGEATDGGAWHEAMADGARMGNGEGALNAAEQALIVSDFLLPVPAMLIGGILLLRKKAFGYVTGPGLFLAYGWLSLALVPFFFIQGWMKQEPAAFEDIIVVSAMALICLVPLLFFLRGIKKSGLRL